MAGKSIEELTDLMKAQTTEDIPMKEVNSSDLLKTKVYSFVSSEMEENIKQNFARDIIIREIQERIRTHDVSFDQLLMAYETISKHKNMGTTALLKPFEPVPNAVGTLIPASNPGDESNPTLDAIKKLDPKTMNAMFMLMNKTAEALSRIPKEKKDEEET